MAEAIIDEDDDFEFDELPQGWLDQVDKLNGVGETAAQDAHGRPYRVRRRIEEWQEDRFLRQIDDLDALLEPM